MKKEANELIKLGGKVWEKNNLKRIYFNRGTCIQILNLDESKLTDFQNKCLAKAKTYYDIENGQYYSDNGTVRVLFNEKKIDCQKNRKY